MYNTNDMNCVLWCNYKFISFLILYIRYLFGISWNEGYIIAFITHCQIFQEKYSHAAECGCKLIFGAENTDDARDNTRRRDSFLVDRLRKETEVMP